MLGTGSHAEAIAPDGFSLPVLMHWAKLRFFHTRYYGCDAEAENTMLSGISALPDLQLALEQV